MSDDSTHAAQQLAREILDCVKRHYLRRPYHRDTVAEILDALAFATAATARGVPERDWRRELEDAHVAKIRESIVDLGGHAGRTQ